MLPGNKRTSQNDSNKSRGKPCSLMLEDTMQVRYRACDNDKATGNHGKPLGAAASHAGEGQLHWVMNVLRLLVSLH